MLKGGVLTTTNLVVVLIHNAALVQILAILVGAARARIKAKAKGLTVESGGPLVAPAPSVRALVATIPAATAKLPFAPPAPAQTLGRVAPQLLTFIVRVVLGQSRARAKENMQRRPDRSDLVQSIIKLPVLAKKSRNLLPKHSISMLQLLSGGAPQVQLGRVTFGGQLQESTLVGTKGAEVAAFAKSNRHRMQRKNLRKLIIPKLARRRYFPKRYIIEQKIGKIKLSNLPRPGI